MNFDQRSKDSMETHTLDDMVELIVECLTEEGKAISWERC